MGLEDLSPCECELIVGCEEMQKQRKDQGTGNAEAETRVKEIILRGVKGKVCG